MSTRASIPADTPAEYDPPEGYRREWRPDPSWTTDPTIVTGLCRRMGPEHKMCEKPAVAALRRTSGWWCYCEDHLYGHRIRDGVVETRYAIPIGEPA